MEAIRCSSRAYVLDTSGENKSRTLLAEITEGRALRLEVEEIPDWFRRAVIDKIRA